MEVSVLTYLTFSSLTPLKSIWNSDCKVHAEPMKKLCLEQQCVCVCACVSNSLTLPVCCAFLLLYSVHLLPFFSSSTYCVPGSTHYSRACLCVFHPTVFIQTMNLSISFVQTFQRILSAEVLKYLCMKVLEALMQT